MKTKKLVQSSILLALAVTIPYLFHFTGIAGKVFLPMHFLKMRMIKVKPSKLPCFLPKPGVLNSLKDFQRTVTNK